MYNSTKNVPSLCIPRVSGHVTKSHIQHTLNSLSLGIIDHIDMIPIRNKNDTYNRIFIHYKSWFETDRASKIHDTLKTGNNIKVIYDEPWFWKISLNKCKNYK